MERFLIQTPDAEVIDLQERLRRLRWPSEATREGWQEGTSLPYLRGLAQYWQEHFSWREQEARLNSLVQFRASAGGLGIHFVYEEGRGPRPLPLMLVHGWPSSFAEMAGVIPLLCDPVSVGVDSTDSFDVIVPSLPGHGYSDAPRDSGMSIWRAADVLHEVMTEVLGYRRYFVSGGDWGAYAASYLASTHPEQVAAIHLSFLPGGLKPGITSKQQPYDELEMNFLRQREEWDRAEGGYEHLQRTKPQTLAYALTDSPVGLAAWILDKMYSWSDCEGDLGNVFSKDELLTNICIYWFTRTIASSSRLYLETLRHPWLLPEGTRIEAPTAISVFPRELSVPPRRWAERIYNVTRWTPMAKGGHFAAAEQPDALVRDIRASFAAFRS